MAPVARAAPPSPDAQSAAQWAHAAHDHGNTPFIVIDKRHAHLWLFDANGTPTADTPVLLGLARGDESVPGIGERPMEKILPEERTTPAGRFVAQPGRNTNGEDIFWIDYDAAVSMHRVRNGNPRDRRLQRLATPTEEDNRISYGCINVPAAFYDNQIKPLFQHGKGVVYVLPETRDVRSLFSSPTSQPKHSTGS